MALPILILEVEMTRLNTPHLTKMLKEDKFEEALREGQARLEDPWENYEDEACGCCAGTGWEDWETKTKCIACEGTGIDFRLVYGFDGKAMYGYTIQNGMDNFKEFCKACREAHAEMSEAERQKVTMFSPYKLPKTIEMELLARGYTSKDIRTGKVREIANIIAREYPVFLTCDYKSF